MSQWLAVTQTRKGLSREGCVRLPSAEATAGFPVGAAVQTRGPEGHVPHPKGN